MSDKRNGKQTEIPQKQVFEECVPCQKRLKLEFFNNPSYDLAIELLGKVLVRKISDTIVKSRIVETELYPGGDDKGSISYNGRRTAANEPVYMDPGTIFVYLTYGMYHCINISSLDHGGAVLLRAVQPLEGVEKMSELRLAKLKSKKNLKFEEICNGPAKLCTALDITRDLNAKNVTTSEELWIEDSEESTKDFKIVKTKRIGIDRAGSEAVNKLYRFYILGNAHVSKVDKERENEQ